MYAQRDPNTKLSTRLVISTLFSSSTGAAVAAASVSPAALTVVLSRAMSEPGELHNDTVVVKQELFVAQHKAKGMTLSQIMMGWGMTVNDVQFNRTCQVDLRLALGFYCLPALFVPPLVVPDCRAMT